jgi:hypothetical protein
MHQRGMFNFSIITQFIIVLIKRVLSFSYLHLFKWQIATLQYRWYRHPMSLRFSLPAAICCDIFWRSFFLSICYILCESMSLVRDWIQVRDVTTTKIEHSSSIALEKAILQMLSHFIIGLWSCELVWNKIKQMKKLKLTIAWKISHRELDEIGWIDDGCRDAGHCENTIAVIKA